MSDQFPVCRQYHPLGTGFCRLSLSCVVLDFTLSNIWWRVLLYITYLHFIYMHRVYLFTHCNIYWEFIFQLLFNYVFKLLISTFLSLCCRFEELTLLLVESNMSNKDCDSHWTLHSARAWKCPLTVIIVLILKMYQHISCLMCNSCLNIGYREIR